MTEQESKEWFKQCGRRSIQLGTMNIDFVSVEDMYQAFRARLLAEKKPETYEEIILNGLASRERDGGEG